MWIQFIMVITADIILEINKEIKKNKKKESRQTSP